MRQIVAIRYIDALYFIKGEKMTFKKFATHVAIGRLASFDGKNMVVSFLDSKNKPERGILVPVRALIFKRKRHARLPVSESILKRKVGRDIGIFWNDMVYFEKGRVPKESTLMYSEGKLFSITQDAIVIKNPETIRIGKSTKVGNHPLEKTSFYVIPKALINSMEIYGKRV